MNETYWWSLRYLAERRRRVVMPANVSANNPVPGSGMEDGPVMLMLQLESVACPPVAVSAMNNLHSPEAG